MPNDIPITRRAALAQLGALSAIPLGAGLASAQGETTPHLAPSTPSSPERLALIAAFKKSTDGVDKSFAAHSFKSDWTMPYRPFTPSASGKLPLVIYLHGSGGLGDDNQMQMGLAGDTHARPIAGLGDGAHVKTLSIDDRRIYLTGQSMGGAGVWHMLAQRAGFFAAAAVCYGAGNR